MAKATERVHFDKFSLTVTPSGLQTLRSYPVKDNSVIRLSITVSARQTDGAHRAVFQRTGLFFRQAGGAVQVQGPTWLSDQTIKSDTNMDIGFVLGPTALTIQVRNAGNISTKWVGFTDKLEVK